MNMLFIHQVRRPKITRGKKVSFTVARLCHTGYQRTGVAVKRIGNLWDIEVTEDGKKMLWQVRREDLRLVN
jgi:hypothetical protein